MARLPRVAAMSLALLVLACGAERREADSPAGDAGSDAVIAEPAPGALPMAVITVRELGEIRIELAAHRAPKTVEHFVALAESGGYDGTTFHRVVPDFMIQGGDPLTRDRDPRNDGMGGSEPVVADEPSGIPHRRGAVSMANRGVPNSAGTQFFIVVADAPNLDGRHTAFGRVVAGMEVVDQIVAVERDVYGRWGPPERPRQDVVMESVRIERPAAGASDSGGATP